MWSLSFILCQASTGTFLLTVFYYLIDVRRVWDGYNIALFLIYLFVFDSVGKQHWKNKIKWKKGRPFHWIGSNSIVIYCGHEILGGYFPFSFEWDDINTHGILLLSNCIGVSCWIIIAWYLFKNKIFYNL